MTAETDLGELCPHERAHRDGSLKSNCFGPENIISHSNGFQLRVPAELSIDYLRVCDPAGAEIAYWSIEELRADPALVIGAAIGAMIG